LNLLKYTLTSHEPLTNTFLGTSSKNNGNPPNEFASAVRVTPSTSDNKKIDVKVIQSKSQKIIVFAETNGDFVDFIFSFLAVPLGSVVNLLGANNFAGCVGNLYKSVENLDSSWCTDSRTVLLNPGVAHQFGCRNQPLNIPEVQPPPITYYYGAGTPKQKFMLRDVLGRDYYDTVEEKIEGGVISKSHEIIYHAKSLIALDPRSLNGSKEVDMGFVKRAALYGVENDLKVKPHSANSFLLYLKELSLSLDDLEAKVISIGEAEVTWLLLITQSFFCCYFTLFDLLKLWCRL